MTVTLRVLHHDSEVTRLTSDGSRVVVGRSAASDLRLPDPSVSQRHATLEQKDGEYVLKDEGSTNGTWVQGARMQPQTSRPVKSGDTVRFGRVWVALEFGVAAAPSDIKGATRDLALALVARAMDDMGDDIVPHVRVVEGPDMGGEMRLLTDHQAYVIGRGEQTDLPLADPDASREHVRVFRRGFSVYVRDLGSKNGTRCGDVSLPLEKDVPWKPQSLLQIGRTVLALHEPVGTALAELSDLPDERVPPEELSQAAPPSVPLTEEGSPDEAAASPVFAALADRAPATSSARKASDERGAEEDPAPAAKNEPSGWTPADFAIIFVAVATIALSALGFFWLMRG